MSVAGPLSLVLLLVFVFVVVWLWVCMLLLSLLPKRDPMPQGLAYSAAGVENCVTAAVRGSTCGPVLALPAILAGLLKSNKRPARCVGSAGAGVCGVV